MYPKPVYKSASFWTMLVAVVAQLLVGLNYGLEAAMLGTISATVIGYLVQRGIIQKENVKADSQWDEGYSQGKAYGIKIGKGEAEDL